MAIEQLTTKETTKYLKSYRYKTKKNIFELNCF